MSRSLQSFSKQNIYTPNKRFFNDGFFVEDFESALVPEVKVIELNNVLITPDNLVFNKGRLSVLSINFSNELNAMSTLTRTKAFVKARFLKKVVNHKHGVFLYAYDMWSASYYHWICEVLPRLWMLKTAHNDGVVILPDYFSKYKFAIDALNLLGVKYLLTERQYSHRFKTLATVDTEPKWGNAVPAIIDSMVKAVKTALQLPKVNPHRKVYISRAKAPSRKISNEAELLPHLQEAGFEIVYAEELSFAEQVKLFHETSVLLAIHGGGMANVVFMQPFTKILEIRAADIKANPLCYWRLANILNLEWDYFPAKESHENSNFDDITLDKDKFVRALNYLK
jgi:capsular polysaccharide biosynthesis protein